MRTLVLSICMLAVFTLAMTSEGFALERVRNDGEKVVTEHGHHGGWRGGRRGGRRWHNGGGCYYYYR